MQYTACMPHARPMRGHPSPHVLLHNMPHFVAHACSMQVNAQELQDLLTEAEGISRRINGERMLRKIKLLSQRGT